MGTPWSRLVVAVSEGGREGLDDGASPSGSGLNVSVVSDGGRVDGDDEAD
jgi:hypothetical protein